MNVKYICYHPIFMNYLRTILFSDCALFTCSADTDIDTDSQTHTPPQQITENSLDTIMRIVYCTVLTTHSTFYSMCAILSNDRQMWNGIFILMTSISKTSSVTKLYSDYYQRTISPIALWAANWMDVIHRICAVVKFYVTERINENLSTHLMMTYILFWWRYRWYL